MNKHGRRVIWVAALLFATASAASAQRVVDEVRANHAANRRPLPADGVVVTSIPCTRDDCRRTFGSIDGRVISPELFFESGSALLSTFRSTRLIGGLIESDCLAPRDRSADELLRRTWSLEIGTLPYQPIRTDQVQFPFGAWRMTFITSVSGPKPVSQCFAVERIR